MTQAILVALIVCGAVIYSGWQLAPVSWRVRFAQAFARACTHHRAAALAPALSRAATRPSGNCSACGARGQCPVGRTLTP